MNTVRIKISHVGPEKYEVKPQIEIGPYPIDDLNVVNETNVFTNASDKIELQNVIAELEKIHRILNVRDNGLDIEFDFILNV
jgi:hypothetical protein